MSRRAMIALLALLAVLLIALLLSGVLFQPRIQQDAEEQVRQQFLAMAEADISYDPADLPEDALYVSPVDFEALWEKNQEIRAWLDIPGTGISHPVLQSGSSNSFYLSHDAAGQRSNAGALFTEDYNSADFSDNVNVIYGHRMRSGAFFGELQGCYEDPVSFEAHRSLTLYLPERQMEFRVVAAVPFTNEHILYNYDFTQYGQHCAFFDRVFSTRDMSANVDESGYPEFGENVLILSTCLRSDRTQRYLVIAKELSE